MERWESLKKTTSTILKPFTSLWDKIWGFLKNVLLGNFLLKIIDDKDAIKTIGPFAKEDDAIEALSNYLKSGVCSWVVSYNG